MARITIDDYGQIMSHLEVSHTMNFRTNDRQKMNIRTDHIWIKPSRDGDAEIIDELFCHSVVI